MMLQSSGDHTYQLPVWYNSSAFSHASCLYISHAFTIKQRLIPQKKKLNRLAWWWRVSVYGCEL